MLESIYYVISWDCHRACDHCYDDKIRRYHPQEMASVLERSRVNIPQIIGHFPDTMQYLDLQDQQADGTFACRTGRIILSGGEVLLEPVRTQVLYPVLEQLRDRYEHAGGVRLVVQTAGDLLTPEIIEDLLLRKVWMISVASIDDYHAAAVDRGKDFFREELARMFEKAGMRLSGLQSDVRKWSDEQGPLYSFFGATPDSWIGKLWPSGRAWRNGLSTARYVDNFCNNWSGGLNFLNTGFSGSEVSIDPEGNLYPCCRKTGLPYGDLCKESLLEILASLCGRPEFEAINSGHPERMGIAYGVYPADFIASCRTIDPKGRIYVNRCIGCDRIHERYLGPILEGLAKKRRHNRRIP